MNTSIEPPQTSSREEFNTKNKLNPSAVAEFDEFFLKKYRNSGDSTELVKPIILDEEVRIWAIEEEDVVAQFARDKYAAANTQRVQSMLGALTFAGKLHGSLQYQMENAIEYLKTRVDRPINSSISHEYNGARPKSIWLEIGFFMLASVVGLSMEWVFQAGVVQGSGKVEFIDWVPSLLVTFLIVLLSFGLKAVVENSNLVQQAIYKKLMAGIFVVGSICFLLVFNISFQPLGEDAAPFQNVYFEVAMRFLQGLLGLVAVNLVWMHFKTKHEAYFDKAVHYDEEWLAYDEEIESLALRGIDVEYLIQKIQGLKSAYEVSLNEFVAEVVVRVKVERTHVLVIQKKYLAEKARIEHEEAIERAEFFYTKKAPVKLEVVK
jgi:hypothetical protein